MQLDVGNEPTLSQQQSSAYITSKRPIKPSYPVWNITILSEIWIIIQSDFWSSPYRQTDGQTESDAYEPTVQNAQVGSKMQLDVGSEPNLWFAPVIGIMLYMNLYKTM